MVPWSRSPHSGVRMPALLSGHLSGVLSACAFHLFSYESSIVFIGDYADLGQTILVHYGILHLQQICKDEIAKR